jgi:PKD repeat protein
LSAGLSGWVFRLISPLHNAVILVGNGESVDQVTRDNGLFLAGLAIGILLFVIAPVSADVHTINPGDSIQNAIDTIADDGDTILLNPGVPYTIVNNIVISTKNITIGANMTAGGNPSNTIIDAGNIDRIFKVTGNYNLTIDNLTLRNGKAPDGAPAVDYEHPGANGGSGGAIQSDGRVTVTSSIIHDCRAGDGGRGADDYSWNPPGFPGNGGWGGAINTTGRVSVNASSFYNCWAGNGGAGGHGEMSQGSAGGIGGNGGAIFTSDSVIIDTTSFTNCHAGDGGNGATEAGDGGKGGDGGAIYAMIALTGTSSSITDCSAGDAGITTDGAGGNGGNGGGIYTTNYTRDLTYMDVGFTTISNCKAGKGSDGGPYKDGGNGGSAGGIFSNWPTVITSSTISNCNATPRGQVHIGSPSSADGRGGAYGGINFGGTLTLENSTFTGNWAPIGGGIGLDEITSGDMMVTSSNFSSNTATIDGGAIYYHGSLYLTSSDFTGNGNSGGVISDNYGQLHLNRFYNNLGKTVHTQWDNMTYAENNWWGTNNNPSGFTSGYVTYIPWLMLCATATPPAISLGDTSAIQANLTFNNASIDTSALGHVPNATPVLFAVTAGSGTLDVVTGGTADGKNTTTFSPTAAGISTIRSRVDGQDIYTDVVVPVSARFDGLPLSGPAALTVQFNDTSGCNTLITWNWSFGDGDWINTTDILKRNASHQYMVPGTYTVSLSIADTATSDTLTRTNYITVLIPPPAVSGITPATGVNTSTVSITHLAGAGFNTTHLPVAARLNRTGNPDIFATDIHVIDSTNITCTFDLTGHEAGKWNVVVTNPDLQDGMLAEGFTIGTSTPAITSIDPVNGFNSSNLESMTIDGSGFWPGTSTTGVVLHRAGNTDITGTNISVLSAAQISCTFDLTGHEAGPWDVVVTNPDGKTATRPGAFEIYPPVPALTGITPAYGVNTSTIAITNLAGSGFWPGSPTGVILNGTGFSDITASSVNAVSGTNITCTFNLNGQVEGFRNVVVTNPDGQVAMLVNGFRVRAPGPTITSITPAQGVNITTVDITNLAGTGFWPGSTTGVFLNRSGTPDIIADDIVVVDGSNITCRFNIAGQEEGLRNIVVTNPDGQKAILENGFRIRAPGPTVTSITPLSGPNSTTVRITNLAGSHFWTSGTTTVFLNQTGSPDMIVAGDVMVVDSTNITCSFDLTGHDAGLRNVVVTNPDGQEAMLEDAFTVRIPGPGITGITPSGGVTPGIINITNLAGSGFWTTGTTNVFLNRTGSLDMIVADDITVVDRTNITCSFNITGQTTGLWNVVVINPDGQEYILENGFRIRLPDVPAPPVVTLDTRDNDDDWPTTAPVVQTTNPLTNTTENVTVNIGGDSAFSRAIVSGTGITSLIVTGTVRSRPDDGLLPPGTVYQYADLVPARYNTISGAEIRFSLQQGWLDDQKIAPRDVVLYRRTSGTWTALPTGVVDTRDGDVYFAAASPGFSLFAIAGSPGSLVTIPAATVPETIPAETLLTTIPVKRPAVTETTAAPVVAEEPSSGFPLMTAALIGSGCVVLIGGAWGVRRWWIRRQNPALFREYD